MGPPPVRPAVGGELDWGVGAVTYGVAQRPSKKDEDRYMLATTGVAWADFVCAVLDGHNGRRAAEACSARLVTLVDAELARLTAAAGGLRGDHADEASPNWHPQARRRRAFAACAGPVTPALGSHRAHARRRSCPRRCSRAAGCRICARGARRGRQKRA